MALSRVVSEIFNVRKCHDLEIGVKGHSRSLKVVPFDRFYMVSYYCSLVTLSLKCTVSEIFDLQLYSDLETRVRVTQGHRKWHHSIRRHDFLLTFHSKYWPISHRFRDKRRFPSKIANFPTAVYLTSPLNWFPLELGIGDRGQKAPIMRLPDSRKSFKIALVV